MADPLSDLQTSISLTEFYNFKELTYFSAEKGLVSTFQLLGMYPSKKTNQLVCLMWKSGDCVNEKR
jgi:hypothetical protein